MRTYTILLCTLLCALLLAGCAQTPTETPEVTTETTPDTFASASPATDPAEIAIHDIRDWDALQLTGTTAKSMPLSGSFSA